MIDAYFVRFHVEVMSTGSVSSRKHLPLHLEVIIESVHLKMEKKYTTCYLCVLFVQDFLFVFLHHSISATHPSELCSVRT
jgi:hypothetical protein